MDTKECTRCHHVKPIAEFNKRKNRPSGIQPQCKACDVARVKQWARDNPDEARARRKRWKAKRMPEWHARYGRKSALKRNYGLTLEDYDAMVEAQGGMCALCCQKPPAVVDHDHATLKVRGLLCRHCNFVIGLYERYKENWDTYLLKGK